MTRRRGGTQTRILWLLYCQLYDSPYPTYYLKKRQRIAVLYRLCMDLCVCCFIDLSNLARSRDAGSPLHFVSLRLRQRGVWRGSFDGTRKMR